jgi:hypothetical protein
MARIEWNEAGTRYFEGGVDRGVLYVGSNPGVPWSGLIAVNHSRSGGEIKPRYLDGVMISNHTAPEQLEASIDAYMYPLLFEQCDGTSRLDNGLRAHKQKRKPFSMVYRTKIGNDIDGVDLAYKIHILYNLRAEPSDRKFPTLGDRVDPTSFSWKVIGRPEIVEGLLPTAYYSIDSRDIPATLLTELENILYGDSIREPSLPSPGELVFLFDSFEDIDYDAGGPLTPVFLIHDAGAPDTPVILILDGGEL